MQSSFPNAVHGPHRQALANSLLPIQPTCENGVHRGAKMLNSLLGKFRRKVFQATREPCSAGCKHKACFHVDTNYASFKMTGSKQKRKRRCLSLQTRRGEPNWCLF